MEEETPLTHQANASGCFFVFNDGEFVRVCDPHCILLVEPRPFAVLALGRLLGAVHASVSRLVAVEAHVRVASPPLGSISTRLLLLLLLVWVQ